MEKNRVLDQLLGELEHFLKALDSENLTSNATVQKCLLSELLQSYLSIGCDEEYIYMNKVLVSGQNATDLLGRVELPDALTKDAGRKNKTPPQKSLPELPEVRHCVSCQHNSVEGYYEEAQPYDMANNDECEAVSSSYESYDEDEVTKGKSCAQHQWPSPEASIELMKDARICAFLWRKKWLGQWAKQLCIIREQRLLCYKSSKEQTPQLDVNLLGCNVVYKEKQLKKKEHKLKVLPVGGEAIVLGLQSKEQAEQWLKVIQEVSVKLPEEAAEVPVCVSDSPKIATNELSERFSAASESGSSTDSHTESPDSREVKKRYGAGLILSNLINMGKKKSSNLDNPENPINTSGYLNVRMNSQWRSRWCSIQNSLLCFYQDKGKTRASHQPVCLTGCMVLPDPSPEHMYSFTILQDGEKLVVLEAKSSADMGHWLGLLLAQSGSKTNPEDLTYDYVDSDRISNIVSAAKTSMYLMQRRISEPNTYSDNLNLSSVCNDPDDLYDNVDNTEPEQEIPDAHVYLDLLPVPSFSHKTSHVCHLSDGQAEQEDTVVVEPQMTELHFVISPKLKCEGAESCIPSHGSVSPEAHRLSSPSQDSLGRHKVKVEVKLGRNRTEAEVVRLTEERERLEKEKQEIRSQLAKLRATRKELKENLAMSTDAGRLSSVEEQLRQMEESCRQEEHRRVEVELQLVEVKESLRKVEAGPFTLGTTVETGRVEGGSVCGTRTILLSSTAAPPAAPPAAPHSDASPINSALTLKNRPPSVMSSSKGNVLQKAMEWEKKSTA